MVAAERSQVEHVRHDRSHPETLQEQVAAGRFHLAPPVGPEGEDEQSEAEEEEAEGVGGGEAEADVEGVVDASAHEADGREDEDVDDERGDTAENEEADNVDGLGVVLRGSSLGLVVHL